MLSTFCTNRPASFSLFQNLNLGNASANPKWHLTISWDTSCQYQCVCKILSKYSKRFKCYRHFLIFSQTGRRQNLHKRSGDKIKCLITGHSYEIQVSVDFLESCNYFANIRDKEVDFSEIDTNFYFRNKLCQFANSLMPHDVCFEIPLIKLSDLITSIKALDPTKPIGLDGISQPL